MATRTPARITARRVASQATAGPTVVAMGNARRSGQVGSLVAWVLGSDAVTDVRRRRASNHLARVQVPACLMVKPDVAIVFASNDGAALPAVLCRLVRKDRRIVVV